jgi:3-methyladenine DNA glycosylase AlkD
MAYDEIISQLNSLSDPSAVAGMSRFGISTKNTLGISIPNLREIAKETGRNHKLAERLWNSGLHEARILACFVDEPKEISEKQMEKWVHDFDSWDVCDQCCGNLFDKTEFAYRKAKEWSSNKNEFVKRAGFALMAGLAVHNKKAKDNDFLDFLPIIKIESVDERNFVKKAVNWALRQIGKRNTNLNRKAIDTAKEISKMDSKSCRWIASHALRELTSETIKKRLR